MAGDDVHPGEMDALTPDELEYLLDHPDELIVHPVALSLGDLRYSLRTVESPTPGPALAEFLDVTSTGAPSRSDVGESRELVAAAPPRVPRKNKEKSMIGSMTAIAATTAGKILLGSAAAAAALGAAQAAGVVDVTPNGGDAQVTTAAQADATAAVVSTTPLAVADATAGTSASVGGSIATDELRFDAAGAGVVAVSFDDDMVRLGSIASAEGWTGMLTADSATDLVVRFESETGDTVTATFSLVSEAATGSSLAVQIVDATGATASARFDTAGRLVVDTAAAAVTTAGEADATVDTSGAIRIGADMGVPGTDAGVNAGADSDGGANATVDAGDVVGTIGETIDATGAIGTETSGTVAVTLTPAAAATVTPSSVGIEAQADARADAEVDAGIDLQGTIGDIENQIDLGGALGLGAGSSTTGRMGLSLGS